MQQSITVSGSSRMRAVLSCGIVGYLLLLGAGVVMHTFDTVGKTAPASYLIVWDMFCGWNSYERRLHFIAEGESGTYYDASEIPGHAITPHGPIERRHFDFHNRFVGDMAANVLARTEHEPIRRVFVVEENWPKRFNLPASLSGDIGSRTDQTYWYTQSVYRPDGQSVQSKVSWMGNQRHRALYDNPRLRAAADRSRVFYAAN